MTNNERILKRIKDSYDKGYEIIKNKNKDYANNEDFFRNFRVIEIIDIPAERAMLSRIVEKLMRVSNLLNKEVSCKDEKIEDTLLDIANLAILLKAFLEEK